MIGKKMCLKHLLDYQEAIKCIQILIIIIYAILRTHECEIKVL